ncbi:uncharacterized protein LOC122506363 [Leptopilina heterotoma]|uniref:uncharacterized protein LOC122506363 n=1 Tax=Leptopilina heterotoma TaxID=63436 RepID=UPI001CA7B9FD|nr:uncharacterized protein LOC122506363 [Leptopilina heterotoma]
MGDEEKKAHMCSCCLCRFLFHFNKDGNQMISGILRNHRHELHQHQQSYAFTVEHGERSLSRYFSSNKPSTHFNYPRSSTRIENPTHAGFSTQQRLSAPPRPPTQPSYQDYSRVHSQNGSSYRPGYSFSPRPPTQPGFLEPSKAPSQASTSSAHHDNIIIHPESSEAFTVSEKRRRISRWNGAPVPFTSQSQKCHPIPTETLFPQQKFQLPTNLLPSVPENLSIKKKSLIPHLHHHHHHHLLILPTLLYHQWRILIIIRRNQLLLLKKLKI